jgi:DNA polymerase-3 subunit epsilon
MKHLSHDGETVTLHRIPALTERATGRRGIPACALDTETTGLDATRETIIEIGIRPFEFDPETGEVVWIGQGYNALQDPGRPLQPEIAALTGLTDADLAGQAIDWVEVRRLLDNSDLVMAHNAAFDRAFVDAALGGDTRHLWGCTYKQVDWDTCGTPSYSQEVLAIWHGWFAFRAHRALDDADNLLFVMEKSTRLPELWTRARQPAFRLRAVGSPYETKDILKARGYRWDSQGRVWWMEVTNEADVEAELAWADEAVYRKRGRLQVEKLEAWERFVVGR